MMSVKKIFVPAGVLAVAVILFSTCRDDSSSRKISRGSSDATGLSGSWSSGCQMDGGKKGYYLDSRTFEGSIFRTTYTTFTDDKCETMIMSQVQTGSYVIAESEAEAGTAIDLTVGSVLITLHNQALTQSYNDRKFCGGGWELDVERAITKEMCKAGGSDNGPDMIYDIFEIANDNIYFGAKDQNHNGKSAEARPITIDQKRPYGKF